jgi:membrane protein implicated in regulation of membrane protease activity
MVLYPICRQYCDVDSCRYYRSITFYILVFFFLFVIWRAMNRKEKEDSQAIRVTGTQQQGEQAEK